MYYCNQKACSFSKDAVVFPFTEGELDVLVRFLQVASADLKGWSEADRLRLLGVMGELEWAFEGK